MWHIACKENRLFSNRKDGSVSIRCEDREIIIEESGIGIKEPERVFERSYKESKQGFGIGLDIVQRLCDAMDIKIKVESGGKGSRFILSLMS